MSVQDDLSTLKQVANFELDPSKLVQPQIAEIQELVEKVAWEYGEFVCREALANDGDFDWWQPVSEGILIERDETLRFIHFGTEPTELRTKTVYGGPLSSWSPGPPGFFFRESPEGIMRVAFGETRGPIVHEESNIEELLWHAVSGGIITIDYENRSQITYFPFGADRKTEEGIPILALMDQRWREGMYAYYDNGIYVLEKGSGALFYVRPGQEPIESRSELVGNKVPCMKSLGAAGPRMKSLGFCPGGALIRTDEGRIYRIRRGAELEEERTTCLFKGMARHYAGCPQGLLIERRFPVDGTEFSEVRLFPD